MCSQDFYCFKEPGVPEVFKWNIPSIISVSFIPASLAMMFTVYFQGISKGKSSIFITVLRQIILLVPLAWLLHFAGLNYVWITFPVTEFVAMCCCLFLYRKGESAI